MCNYSFANREVKVLIDFNSNNTIDKVLTIYIGQWYPPASLAINPTNGDLYIAEVNMTFRCPGNVNEKILQYIENNVDSNEYLLDCDAWFDLSEYDTNYSAWHGLHYLQFNKDNDLCIALGMDCNECDTVLPKSTIQCFENNDVLNTKIWASGIRNSVGYDFDPFNGNLWFTDNGRDDLLNYTNMPDDELNYVSYKGEFFGYPYCHSEGTGNPYDRDVNQVYAIVDPKIGDGFTNNCTQDVTLAKQVEFIYLVTAVFWIKNNRIRQSYKLYRLI